ncbi:hypothetical protein V6N13_110732 [Hibiscus sabdariffa]|uniref:Uncharacterized protein n=1 Tax=Hibiscus sabdariffa TaxID=183260 RepID=A0ABR2TIA1_9ROSI
MSEDMRETYQYVYIESGENELVSSYSHHSNEGETDNGVTIDSVIQYEIEFDLRGMLMNGSYLKKVMNGSNDEVSSLSSQPYGVANCELAIVVPLCLNRAQIIVHNGVECKVRAMSDIVTNFLSPTDM